MPRGILALSADGSKDGTGIVWASHPTDDNAINMTVKGTLRAFDARDPNMELWNSDRIPAAKIASETSPSSVRRSLLMVKFTWRLSRES